MIVNDALICPECGNEIDGRMADWGMLDGETHRFHCDECGVVVDVTACMEYTVRWETGNEHGGPYDRALRVNAHGGRPDPRL